MAEPLRVLLVEDDEQDAELVQLELERGGFEVQSQRVDTEDALRRMLADRVWDLIISDFAMPAFDGLRAFDVFRETGVDTPFIFVSGALGEERAVAAMRAGARDYLLKGNLGRLNAAVRRELTEAANRRRLLQAEKRSSQEKSRLNAALTATAAGLFEFSIPERNDTFVSERWAEILGYVPSDLLGNGPVLDWLFEQVLTKDRDGLRNALDRLITGEIETLHCEMKVRHRGGQWIDVSFFAIVTARDSEASAQRIVAVMLDSSATRGLERRYQQAQKMEAIGRLAGGIAHDFNNLLTAIISFAGFVRDDLPQSDRRRDDIREVLAAADRATGLTRQLLLFSRQQPADVQPIDVGAAIDDIKKLLVRTIGEDIELTTNRADRPEVVLADCTQLDQIVLNLAVNARDAMPEGGSLWISVERVVIDEHDARTMDVSHGTYVQIAVSDSGTGIDDETLKRIFEPFFTTKGPTEGTGLGLATSFGIAKQLGGTIEVESKLGEGTTFKILLPIFEGSPLAHSERTSTNGELNGTETILVVEDERALRRLVERALHDKGYTVLVAEDGDLAMELFQEHQETIDMVFSDVVLPKGNGFALAEWIRERRPDIPILLTSGYTDRRVMREGPDFDIFWKPYAPPDLARRIRSCLDRADKRIQQGLGAGCRGAILIVEDQDHVRKALCRILQGEGYQVTATVSIATARECLETVKVPFDAVLSDLQLDDGSGMELIRWIEQSMPNLASRCLLVTGSKVSVADSDFVRGNPERVVRKPIVVDELLASVARVMEKAE